MTQNIVTITKHSNVKLKQTLITLHTQVKIALIVVNNNLIYAI